MNIGKKAGGVLATAALMGGAIVASAASAAAGETASATTGSWPIVDEAGVTRSTMWFDGLYLSACYAGADDEVMIEVRYTDGKTNRRFVPQFGCTAVGAHAGTGDVTAVRGLVAEFANPWHEVG
jgi:hypothetical protein